MQNEDGLYFRMLHEQQTREDENMGHSENI